MNILFDIGHPAHVHLFRPTMLELQKKGHHIFVAAKRTNAIVDLLKAYNISYYSLGKKYDSRTMKYASQLLILLKLLYIVIRHKVDIGVGITMSLPIVSRYTKMIVIGLDDDDSSVTPIFAKYINQSDVILTPAALKNDSRGKNHVTYEGYHELAYLHPNQFSPYLDILNALSLKKGEAFFILRFNSFKAHHDTDQHGLSITQKQHLIQLLSSYGKVFISTEDKDHDFAEYKLNIKPDKIHSVLRYASMLICDSQTMTSEASVLGTPALKCNTFAGRLSIPNELENKYGLCYSYKPTEFNSMLEKVTTLLEREDLKEEWQKRRQKMLNEKIDVTAFMIWLIENYPKSIQIMKDDPEYQYRFR